MKNRRKEYVRVKASPGLLVPKENGGTYIGQEAEVVPYNPYYRRLLAIGDLLLWPRPVCRVRGTYYDSSPGR